VKQRHSVKPDGEPWFSVGRKETAKGGHGRAFRNDRTADDDHARQWHARVTLRMTTALPADEHEAPLSPLELAPYARRSVQSARRMWLALGLIVLALGSVVFVILAGVSLSGAARPEDGVPFLAGLTFVIAVLPGFFMTRAGMKRDDRHPLVLALEQHPERVRGITYAYQAVDGDWSRVATVSLTDGSVHAFFVPSVPAPDVRAPARLREPRAAADGTVTFSGRFVDTPVAPSGLLGEGSVTVGPSGLVLAGAQERLAIARSIAVLVGAIAGALTIGVFLELPGIDDPRGPAVGAIVAALLGWAGTEALLVRALPHRTMRVEIPWPRVGVVKQEGAAVALATSAPSLQGISRFVTDHPAALVRACAERRR
jgi:hypothetical protein